jgi:hypothetical protein
MSSPISSLDPPRIAAKLKTDYSALEDAYD